MSTDANITKVPCPCEGSCGYCRGGHLVCKCCDGYVDASDHHTYDEYAWCAACKAALKFDSDGAPVECCACDGHVESDQDTIFTEIGAYEACWDCREDVIDRLRRQRAFFNVP